MRLFTMAERHPWTARPARAIRYSVAERLADSFLGWRDGRRGIPAVPAELLDIGPGGAPAGEPSDARISTNRLEQIRHHHHGRMEGERNAFHEFRASRYGELVEAVRRVRTTQDTATRHRRDYDAVSEPPSEQALTSRRSAEADRSPELVRQRRLGEHERRVRAAEERLTAAESELAGARAELALLRRTIEDRWSQTLVRTRRLHEHGHRRAHVYWRQLVRQHPQGDVLNGALATIGPDLPEWARGDAPMPALAGPDETGDHGDPHVPAPQAAPNSRA